MKTLLSMTDFVLSEIKEPYTDSERLRVITNYAAFLKQPLKLEMFVPCDQYGNFWEYPPTKEEWEWARKDSADAEQSFKQKEYYYAKAKEKVLFEGFEVENDLLIIPTFGKQEIKNIKGLTIEALTGFKIELTPTALNQIS